MASTGSGEADHAPFTLTLYRRGLWDLLLAWEFLFGQAESVDQYLGVVVDPVTLVVAALVAGASAGATSAATDAVKDAYQGLKNLVARAFAGRSAGEVALQEIDEAPEEWRGALTSEVRRSGAAEQPEVQAAAQMLLDRLQEAGLSTGDTYTVNAHDHSRNVVGPHASVDMRDTAHGKSTSTT